MTTLSETLHELADQTRFSGLVRLDRDDVTEFAEPFGWAHRGFGVPNRVDTQFALASGGKTFTALAVVSLVVDGKLSLDTTARSVLGADLPLIADDVTVGHLLAHRSGIGDYIDEADEEANANDYVLASPVHRLADTEAFIVEVDGYPTKFAAGERFEYCNGGYIVLALIAERVSGVGYHELVTERVIRPAGLEDTAFLRSDEPTGRMALGYLALEGHQTNILHLPVRGNGDGGIYSTVADLRTFWRALFAGQIVPATWVTEMTRPHSEVPEEEANYGLGFWLAEAGSVARMVGGDVGVSFCSSHDPDSGLTWTVVSNTTDGAWPLVRHLRQAFED